jgi:muramoyltetrapeptide carboxypeptidase LdcA involved in peptidoglycan recycling
MIVPPNLKRGDKIAVVSLSSGILGDEICKHQLDLGVRRLKDMGLEPIFMDNALKGSAFLALHPEARANDLKQAFYDDTIRGILCAIGGDDTFRLLPYLLDDLAFVEQVRTHPKIFSGFSDTTNNHLMFYKLGMTSFYGPNFLSDLAELEEDMLPYTRHAFHSYFRNPPRRYIASSPVWYEDRTDYSAAALGTKRVAHEETKRQRTLYGNGIVDGRLLGGCMESLFDGYTGSRYPEQYVLYQEYDLMPKAEDWKDKVFFFETSEEMPTPEMYKTMLEEFERQGIFANVSAMLVGKPMNEMYYEEYNQILLGFCIKWNVPTLVNVNFGHCAPRNVLPYGRMMHIYFDYPFVEIIEPVFRLT